MLNKVKDSLKRVDIFGQSITLNFRKEEFYKTSFGGFTSICIIGLIISFFYSNIISFFAMTDVYSDTSMHFEQQPGTIQLSKDQFMFAVQIQQDNFTTTPYLNISVEQRHYHREEDGSKARIPNVYVDMVPCTIKHFSDIFEKHGQNVTENFILNNLGDFLCPSLDSFDMMIGGIYSNVDYRFIKISVTACNRNRNDNFTWQPSCKSVEDMEKYLTSNGNFRLQLFTTNYLINPQDPNNYVKPYLASDLHFSFVPNKLFAQADIFFKSKTVTTDSGILMYPQEESEYYGVRDQGDMREQFDVNRLTPGYYGAFYFVRSPFSYQVKRSFLKLDALLSYLGGFLQFVIVILGLFVSFYNRQHLIISMANDLYEFHSRGKRKDTFRSGKQLLFQTQKGIEILKKKKARIQTLQHVPDQIPFTQKPVMQQMLSDVNYPPLDSKGQNSMAFLEVHTEKQPKRLSYLKTRTTQYFDKFRNFMSRTTLIGISFRFILSEILDHEYFMNEESLLLKKATQQIQQELDIGYILKQMYELAKLKQVLFSKEQTALFEFSHKPSIMLCKHDDQNKSEGKLLSDYRKEDTTNQQLTQFNDLVNSYRTITALDQDKMTDEQKRFNHRLVQLIGKELASIIEEEIANYESVESFIDEMEEKSPNRILNSKEQKQIKMSKHKQ